MLPADVFVLSKRQRHAQNEFFGHCFVGDDLVIGGAGHTQFASERAAVSPGLDGAYTVVAQQGDVTVVGTDFTGYHRVFLYRAGDDWLVSNSFWTLVEEAFRRRLPITVSPSALASFQMPGSIGNQLSSAQTAVAEIVMVSSRCELRLSRNAPPRLVRTARARNFDTSGVDYPTALTNFLLSWRARMRTVLRSELEVHSDLTGGRDSRAVFTLLASAESDDELRRVRFIGSAAGSRDDEAGSAVLARYGLGFQRAAPTRSLTTDESFAQWRRHSLGVYGPVYFARRARDDGHIHFGGGGGESHRSFYSTTDVRALFRARRAAFPTAELCEEASAAALAAVDEARTGFEADLDDSALHYRHFRDRLHCGRSPLAANISLPLASGYLAAAAGILPYSQRERAQVLADIMLNIDRDTALLPYDQDRKAFTQQNLDDMTDVRAALRSEDRTGRVFAQPTGHEQVAAAASGIELHRRLAMLLHDSIPSARRIGVISESTITHALEASESAVDTGRLSHAIAGQPISTVILAGELARKVQRRGIRSWLIR